MHSSQLSLLIVEDDEDLGFSLAEFFRDYEFFVDTALSGAEALAKLKVDPLPHVVLLDEGMPGMSGLEVLRQIRSAERLRRLPVIVMSGSPPPPAQCSPWFQKPFDTSRLLEAVRNLVDKVMQDTAIHPLVALPEARGTAAEDSQRSDGPSLNSGPC